MNYACDLAGLKKAFDKISLTDAKTVAFGGVYVLSISDSGMDYTLTAMGRKLISVGPDSAFGASGSTQADTRMMNGLLKLLEMGADYKAVKGKVERIA